MDNLFKQISNLKNGESLTLGKVKITQDGIFPFERYKVEVELNSIKQLEQVVKLIYHTYDMRKMFVLGSPYSIKFKIVFANCDDAYRFAKYLTELLK